MRILKREDGRRFVLPLFLCCAALACRAPNPGAATALVVQGADGFPIAATLYTPDGDDPPGLILVHMLGADRGTWSVFAEQARRDGYMVIAFDMRGHGESAHSEARDYNPRSMDVSEWLDVEEDIGRAKTALIEAGARSRDIAVVGASIGANLALRYADRDPEIQAVVLLSPGESFRGVDTLQAMEHMTTRPVLIMASEGDSYSAESGRKLETLGDSFCELRVYPGTAHGTDLIASQPEVAGQILLWLRPILRSKEEKTTYP